MDYKKFVSEFIFNGLIATSLSYFFIYQDWSKSFVFGWGFGLLMAVFYTFILPRFKKK